MQQQAGLLPEIKHCLFLQPTTTSQWKLGAKVLIFADTLSWRGILWYIFCGIWPQNEIQLNPRNLVGRLCSHKKMHNEPVKRRFVQLWTQVFGTFGTKMQLNPSQKESAYLVKLFIKLAELGHFLHDLLPHEEGRVQHAVTLTMQYPEGVIDESLLQEHQWALRTPQQRKRKGWECGEDRLPSLQMRVAHLQKVTSASSHDRSFLPIKPVNHHHQVNMGVLLPGSTVPPGPLYLVVCILSEFFKDACDYETC